MRYGSLNAKIRQISQKLSDIMEHDTDEKVMVFTDNRALQELCARINSLLSDRHKIKAEYRKREISYKKMLSNISHDIKTPLTVILGYLEMMRLAGAENEELRKVEAKAGQVMELIDQFFTLAKLEAGDMAIETGTVNVSELCRESMLGYYDILQSRDFAVELSIPEKDMFALGETGAVGRILNNLISNAVRYGCDGKYIGLTLWESGDCVYIDITDRGRGIEKAFARNVFDRLYTLEDSRNREIQGNGLGLTIARNLALQMGGDILLESEPHVKTTFTVKLKKAAQERNL